MTGGRLVPVVGVAVWLAAALGCGGSAPPEATPAPSEPSAEPADPGEGTSVDPAAAVSDPVASSATAGDAAAVDAVPVTPASGLMFVELDPDAGPLRTQLVAQFKRAREAGRAPFVELYGNWCEPCRMLRASLTDPLMQDAFHGTYVVLVDTSKFEVPLQDRSWGGGQDAYSVPAFYVIEEDGTAGAFIDGHAWGPNVPDEMAPPLRAFFVAHGASPAGK